MVTASPMVAGVGQFRPKFQCDASGNNCLSGQSLPPCPTGPAPFAGCQPPAETKVEFYFPKPSDPIQLSYFDITLVERSTLLKTRIRPSVAASGSCDTFTCNLSFGSCPSNEAFGLGDLRVQRNGSTVMCLSPCKRSSFPRPYGLGDERDGWARPRAVLRRRHLVQGLQRRPGGPDAVRADSARQLPQLLQLCLRRSRRHAYLPAAVQFQRDVLPMTARSPAIMAAFLGAALAQTLAPATAHGTRYCPAALAPLVGHTDGAALAINDHGLVVGASAGGGELSPAVRWDRRGRPTLLPPLPGDRDSEATGINVHGVVVGNSQGATISAVRWAADGQPTRLPPLAGDWEGEAFGINAHGLIVGVSRARGAIGDKRGGLVESAVVWDRAGAPRRLELPRGFEEGMALAINDRGQVAGFVYRSGSSPRPRRALVGLPAFPCCCRCSVIGTTARRMRSVREGSWSGRPPLLVSALPAGRPNPTVCMILAAPQTVWRPVPPQAAWRSVSPLLEGGRWRCSGMPRACR